MKLSDAIAAGGEAPVFEAPWEAQAVAMAVALHARGLFTWTEWAAALAREIAKAGAADSGAEYYRHWLGALEHIVTQKAAVTPQQLAETRDAWDRAARATPHGMPIVLDADRQLA